jgi:hypothetical protein
MITAEHFYKKYGYCIIPKGAFLYRMGALRSYGAFFALHPQSAHGFEEGMDRTIQKWVVKKAINTLFAVKYLDKCGHPQTIIDQLYAQLVGPLIRQDDLDVKGRNEETRTKFLTALTATGLSGWLSTQENRSPLELFLLPEYFSFVQLKGICGENSRPKNTLRKIEIIPSKIFVSKTKRSITPTWLEYLNSIKHCRGEWRYGLLQRLFSDSNEQLIIP